MDEGLLVWFGGVVGVIVVPVLVAWINDAVASRSSLRTLERLERCVTIRDKLKDDAAAVSVLDAEIDALVATVRASARRRPHWQSVVRYLTGLAIVWTLLLFPMAVLLPDMLGQPGVLIGAGVATAVIFAIELQPLFLRRWVGRFAPDSRQRTDARAGASTDC